MNYDPATLEWFLDHHLIQACELQSYALAYADEQVEDLV